MWRNLIKSFERSVIISHKQLKTNRTIWKSQFKNTNPHQRFFGSTKVLSSSKELPAVPHGVAGTDPEYIVPFKLEYEKPCNPKRLMDTLRTKFRLSEEDIERIMSDEVIVKSYRKKSLFDNLETLCKEGVTNNNVVEYSWVMTLDKKRLVEKISLIRSIKGFRDINDFVPLLRLHLSRLGKLVTALNRESKNFTSGNRFYYIAEKLKVQPCTVTKYLAKRLFILEMPLDMFKTNLKNMIDYKVEPMNILKDLWGFRYAPRAVELRLKRASQAKKDKIMPWMVRCPETILQKSLQLSLDELEVLGQKSSVAEYIGERLGFSVEEAQAIMNRHPQVNTVRVTKIKEVLDYLLDEAKFTRYDIAQVPRILCHSLETTKERIEELKQYGCRPSTLVILCRSRREYEKFLNQWKQQHNPNKSFKKSIEETEEIPKD